jgi:hypothetical protein
MPSDADGDDAGAALGFGDGPPSHSVVDVC